MTNLRLLVDKNLEMHFYVLDQYSEQNNSVRTIQ